MAPGGRVVDTRYFFPTIYYIHRFFHFVGILPSSPDKTCLHLWHPMSNPSSPEEVTLGKNLVGELPAVPSIGHQVLTVFAPPLQSHRPGKVIQSQ